MTGLRITICFTLSPSSISMGGRSLGPSGLCVGAGLPDATRATDKPPQEPALSLFEHSQVLGCSVTTIVSHPAVGISAGLGLADRLGREE